MPANAVPVVLVTQAGPEHGCRKIIVIGLEK